VGSVSVSPNDGEGVQNKPKKVSVTYYLNGLLWKTVKRHYLSHKQYQLSIYSYVCGLLHYVVV
jgi:hypothetical protein